MSIQIFDILLCNQQLRYNFTGLDFCQTHQYKDKYQNLPVLACPIRTRRAATASVTARLEVTFAFLATNLFFVIVHFNSTTPF